MRLRADQALMLGVVGLGLLAVVLLPSARGGEPEPRPPPPTPPPPTPPAGMPGGRLPSLPQNQVVITKGRRYWGRFDFPVAPSRAGIVAMIENLGLDNAVVYESEAEARQFIPPIPLVLENASVNTRWFQATAARTDNFARNPRPEVLTYLWIRTG